jgi:hypothetical protein
VSAPVQPPGSGSDPDELSSNLQITHWISKACDIAKAEALASALQGTSDFGRFEPSATRVLTRLLVRRGITDLDPAASYLKPSLSHLHSPYRMLGMKAAVDRIEAAIERKEAILIYGDYDVDGTTAIVILKTAIERCGGIAEFHVPHRVRDGYDMRDH